MNKLQKQAISELEGLAKRNDEAVKDSRRLTISLETSQVHLEALVGILTGRCKPSDFLNQKGGRNV